MENGQLRLFAARATASIFLIGLPNQVFACDLDGPYETLAQEKERAVATFKRGMMVGVIRSNYQNGIHSLEVVKSFDPRLRMGVRWSRRTEYPYFNSCGPGLQPGDSLLMWIDPDPRLLPGHIGRHHVEALLAAGLLTDRTALDYLR